MRHSAGAWSGKTSEVPSIPFLCFEMGLSFRYGSPHRGQWAKNAKYEYCCKRGVISIGRF